MTLTIEECKKFIVADLKEQLKLRGASTNGKKADLLERLIELVREENSVIASKTTATDSTATFPSQSEIVPEDRSAPIDPEITSASPIEDTTSKPIDDISDDAIPVVQGTGEKNVDDGKILLEESSISISGSKSLAVAMSEKLVDEVAKDDENNDHTNTESLIPKLSNSSENSETTSEFSNPKTLNEIIKSNLVKKIALSSQEVAHEKEKEIRTRFVRIDNFQRPLHVKMLVKWFEETLGLTGVTEENVWVNSIKTHCYVDLASVEQAETCIDKATGLKFPSTSARTLVANFTTISAKDAPTSAEALRLPGEWKLAAGDAAGSPKFATAGGAAAASGAGVKRKAEDVGGQMLKKAVEMATGVAKSPRNSSGGTHPAGAASTVPAPSGGSVAGNGGFLTRKHKLELGIISDDPAAVPGQQDQAPEPQQPPTLSLDQLFKKTKAAPSIYWLPASVERQAKNKARASAR